MPAPRTWYLIAGAILALGAIAALVKQQWVALAVFTISSALMFVLAAKIDRWIDLRTSRD